MCAVRGIRSPSPAHPEWTSFQGSIAPQRREVANISRDKFFGNCWTRFDVSNGDRSNFSASITPLSILHDVEYSSSNRVWRTVQDVWYSSILCDPAWALRVDGAPPLDSWCANITVTCHIVLVAGQRDRFAPLPPVNRRGASLQIVPLVWSSSRTAIVYGFGHRENTLNYYRWVGALLRSNNNKPTDGTAVPLCIAGPMIACFRRASWSHIYPQP